MKRAVCVLAAAIWLAACSPGGLANRAGAVQEMDADEGESEARAARVTEAVNKVEGVSGAGVVVTGKTAIVGISVDNDPPDDAALIRLKQRVEAAAKQADGRLTRVAVSIAPEVFEQMTGQSGRDTEDVPGNVNDDIFFQALPSI